MEALKLTVGRHAEIVPRDESHYVLVDGLEWSRHDDLAKAEAVRSAIVARWATEYDRRAAELASAGPLHGIGRLIY
jgi:hypothetical protein